MTVVLFGLVFATMASDDGQPEAQSEAVEFIDMTDEFADMADWAVGLFDEAGMQLPAMRFVHHGDDPVPCGGWKAVHRYDDHRSTIGICTTEPGKVTAALILHEVAHAWAAHDLSDEHMAEFQKLRGWTHWRNHEQLSWAENGSEQAAEIIMWGLIDRPVGVVTIDGNGCDDLDAGYRALTGQPPLHGYRDHC